MSNNITKTSDKILLFIAIFLFIALFGPLFYIMISKSMDDGYYTGKMRTEKNSVQVNIVKEQAYNYTNSDKVAVYMTKNKDYGILLSNIMTTYDGHIYAYNEKDLNCVDNITYTPGSYNEEMPKEKNAYKEILEKNGKSVVQVYAKTATQGSGGKGGSGSLVYFKEKICSNIYPVIKEEK